jgi:5-methylcytosine-specific restriction endonuclease McrA
MRGTAQEMEVHMVFVINHDKTPLSPVYPATAKKLLKDGKAAIWRTYPFSIIMKAQQDAIVPEHEYRLKIDYGSKTTGMAILSGSKVIWLAQLNHRTNIKELMDKRRNYRRRRRVSNLRYRAPRYLNRRRAAGWLPPSLQSRVNNIASWVGKLRQICPITHISYEHCKFDTQLMRNPEISGIEYMQGTLHGYEIREYLLEKFDRTCVYCGKKNVPLEIEHIIPKSRGGSNRIDNLAIACHGCNQRKGALTAEEFGYPDIQIKVKKTLRDPAVINATRWKVYEALIKTGLPVECGSGAVTKMNRIRMRLPKAHHIDACCVGASTPDKLHFATNDVLYIAAKGRGSHCRTNVDKQGFARGYRTREKIIHGFQTGDIVKATVPKGKNKGVHVGRVTCRKRGEFNIRTKQGLAQCVNHKYVQLIQKCDGYGYFVSGLKL